MLFWLRWEVWSLIGPWLPSPENSLGRLFTSVIAPVGLGCQLVPVKQWQSHKQPATGGSRKIRALHALDSASRGGSSASSHVVARC